MNDWIMEMLIPYLKNMLGGQPPQTQVPMGPESGSYMREIDPSVLAERMYNAPVLPEQMRVDPAPRYEGQWQRLPQQEMRYTRDPMEAYMRSQEQGDEVIPDMERVRPERPITRSNFRPRKTFEL